MPTLLKRDEQNTRPRAVIWAYRDLKMRLVATNITDLAAVLVEIRHRTILVISVYIPRKYQRKTMNSKSGSNTRGT
jgi:hypothetical protein